MDLTRDEQRAAFLAAYRDLVRTHHWWITSHDDNLCLESSPELTEAVVMRVTDIND